MYLTTVARSLGDPRGGKALPPQKKCGRIRLPSGQIITMDCNKPVRGSGLGTIAPCGDAGTGLLIDCWKAAEAKGLSGLSAALDQAQLAKVATAYQRFMRPDRLAGLGGWVFNGTRMVWSGGRLGDDSGMDPGTDMFFDPSSTYLTPQSTPTPLIVAPDPRQPMGPAPDPFAMNTWAGLPPLKLPSSIQPSSYQAPIPSVTAATLLAAAQLPNAPAVVKAAAAQLPASSAASWFSAQMISGIPNYLLLGAGGLILLVLLGGRRR